MWLERETRQVGASMQAAGSLELRGDTSEGICSKDT